MLKETKLIAFAATSDPKKSRTFYETKLGLTCISSDDFATAYECKGTMLRIQHVHQLKPQPHTQLGWQTSNILKEITALISVGISFEKYDGLNQDENKIWHAPSGAHVAWFKDPDGNILSLTEL
jgi:hypothetical protein